MATLEDLPDDAWPAIARYLTGDAYWRERLTDINEEQCERGDITTTTTTIVTAPQRYARAYSLRVQGFCKDDATADTVAAAWLARDSRARVSLFNARAIREDTPFAFDTWFCLLDGGDDKYKNATTRTGGILFGTQSVSYDDNRWAYYHQQFVVVSADRKLLLAYRRDPRSRPTWRSTAGTTPRSSTTARRSECSWTERSGGWVPPKRALAASPLADQQFSKPRRCERCPPNGLIDEFRMWKSGLSSEDTQALSQRRAELVRTEPGYSLKKPHRHSPSYYAPQNTRRASCS